MPGTCILVPTPRSPSRAPTHRGELLGHKACVPSPSPSPGNPRLFSPVATPSPQLGRRALAAPPPLSLCVVCRLIMLVSSVHFPWSLVSFHPCLLDTGGSPYCINCVNERTPLLGSPRPSPPVYISFFNLRTNLSYKRNTYCKKSN